MEYHNLKAEVAFVVCFKVQTLGLFWSKVFAFSLHDVYLYWDGH